MSVGSLEKQDRGLRSGVGIALTIHHGYENKSVYKMLAHLAFRVLGYKFNFDPLLRRVVIPWNKAKMML